MKNDPGELANLADKPEHRAIQNELHTVLTSLVRPDEITERVFEVQEGMLRQMAAARGFEEFYQLLVSRLGEGQARALALRYHKRA